MNTRRPAGGVKAPVCDFVETPIIKRASVDDVDHLQSCRMSQILQLPLRTYTYTYLHIYSLNVTLGQLLGTFPASLQCVMCSLSDCTGTGWRMASWSGAMCRYQIAGTQACRHSSAASTCHICPFLASLQCAVMLTQHCSGRKVKWPLGHL